MLLINLNKIQIRKLAIVQSFKGDKMTISTSHGLLILSEAFRGKMCSDKAWPGSMSQRNCILLACQHSQRFMF